jgi:hypothetical protein
MRAMISLSTAIAACLAAAACSIFAPVCTLKACPSSLTIELTTTPTEPFRIEALAVGSEDRVYECLDPSRCIAAASFQDFTPEEVIVRVTTQSGTVEQTFRPSYEIVHPNGPRCEPTCRQAFIRVPLPS